MQSKIQARFKHLDIAYMYLTNERYRNEADLEKLKPGDDVCQHESGEIGGQGNPYLRVCARAEDERQANLPFGSSPLGLVSTWSACKLPVRTWKLVSASLLASLSTAEMWWR